eukprot:GEZU01006286.1.p1 GENE.GEZU01006286.1~~GEZU01006286.1.p1  ORF type:complete len:337 (+),score=98.58 GEZU01006286.1:341-1351(+)
MTATTVTGADVNTATVPTATKTESNVNPHAVYNAIAEYAKPNDFIAWWELISSLIIFYTLLYMRSWSPLIILTGLMRMRLFVIFHDMGHGSYFSSARLNKIFGTLIGSIALFVSYTYWNKGHNHHHKHANNMDRSLFSQSSPWTVKQYLSATPKQRLIYKFIYGHYTFFTINPLLYFAILNRFVATLVENALSLGYLYLILYLGGPWHLVYELATGVVAASSGFFLFHLQHTFDNVYRRRSDKWSYFDVGMKGCSYFVLPPILSYFTFGIEYHHIHHLNSKVPGYNLRKCHDDLNEKYFQDVPRLSLMDTIKTLGYSIYDEDEGRFKSVYSIKCPN